MNNTVDFGGRKELLNAYEINNHSGMERFKSENNRIGQCEAGEFGKFDIDNIWICELFQNKETKEYCLLVTRDDDEQWIVFRVA